jgi:ABC-type hemin transport system ATPase subunit
VKYFLFITSLIATPFSYTMELTHPQLKHGALIAIEGPDGSGKSTLAKHLSKEIYHYF